jgi:hypothetical protein
MKDPNPELTGSENKHDCGDNGTGRPDFAED